MAAVPGEALPADGADVGLVHAAIVRAYVVRHAVFPLESLLADRALERLLVRVGQLVSVQVVDITEGFAAHLAPVVLLHRLGRLLGHTRLADGNRGGRNHGARGRGRGRSEDVRGVSVVFSRHTREQRHHGGRRRLRCLFRSRHHLDAGVTRLVPSQMVAVSEGLVAVAADKRRFAFGFLLHDGHWCSDTTAASSATMAASAPSSARPAAHAVLKEVGGAHWGLLIERDGHDGLLVLRLGAGIQQRQQAVRAHLVLMVQCIIGLLEARNRGVLN